MVHIFDDSDVKGAASAAEIPFDMLVVGVGAENATFGIKGVKEHACFLYVDPTSMLNMLG